MEKIIQRMIRAAKLEPALYEEVERDEEATSEALVVVVAASVAGGLGSLAYGGLGAMLTGVFTAVLGWVAWSAVIMVIGTRVLPEPGTQADMGELLRCLGYAQAPGLLHVAGIIPILGWPVVIIAGLWTIGTTVVAVRQALDYTSTARAIGVTLLGWLAMLVVSMIFGGCAAMA